MSRFVHTCDIILTWDIIMDRSGNKNNIDRLKKLSNKYSVDESLKSEANKISQQYIPEAVQQSQKMALKLKQIRTILGYQNKSNEHTKPRQRIPYTEIKKDEKGASIKNFVVLMRKKRESGGLFSNHKN